MQLTPYPDINNFLDTLLLQLKTILAERLIGVYLFGSLVWGDFEYGSSDIDLLVVTSLDITNNEFDKLDYMQKELAKTYIHAKEGMIEIAYLSENALQTFQTKRSQIALIHPGEPFRIKDAGKEWLMNWYLVQEKALTLFGPPPKTLIAPTTREEFIQAVRVYANAWRNWIEGVQGRPDQAYAILTLCRACYTSKNGEQTSKKRAAQWIAKAFPQWSTLIENALKWREDWRNNQVDAEETLPETKQFIHFILDQITNTDIQATIEYRGDIDHMDYQQVIALLQRAYNRENASARDQLRKEDWKVAERQHFLDILKRERKTTLLEVGAGTGSDGLFFKNNGMSVICTDLSPSMVELCREKGLEAYVMDFFSLDFEPASFEAIYAMNCLLHVPTNDLPAVLEKLRSLLCPGGLFFLGVYEGKEEEGIREEDWHQPPRFFAQHTEAFMEQAVAPFFDTVSFKTIPIENGAWHFQSMVLRRRNME